MGYIDGFVLAVPAANRDIYLRHAAEALPLFRELGATRMVEAWGDDVPDGQVTDFKRAVQAEPDEVVIFSWLEYPDKATRDAANEGMMQDPRMKEMAETMPFDGKRMIFGGFSLIVEGGGRTGATYIDGSLLPVSANSLEAYREHARSQVDAILEHGALRVVDAWGDDIPDGKRTDFKRAVQARDGETTVFSFVEWPDKAVRDEAWPRLMADPRIVGETSIYDGRRRVFGGFRPILDE